MARAFMDPFGTPIVPAPADPWAGRTREVPIVHRQSRRPVYGYVYGLVLAGQQPGDRDPYIGKCVGGTPAAITNRVHGKSASAHTSPQSIARDPWKAAILPGRRGWVRLETVYSCGDPAEDDRALRRAESDWIARRNPVHNDVRPAQSIGEVRPIRFAAPRRARVRLPRARPFFLLLFLAAGVFLVARLVVAMQLPWPAAPWVVSPVAGGMLGWLAFWRVHRAWRKVFGRSRR